MTIGPENHELPAIETNDLNQDRLKGRLQHLWYQQCMAELQQLGHLQKQEPEWQRRQLEYLKRVTYNEQIRNTSN